MNTNQPQSSDADSLLQTKENLCASIDSQPHVTADSDGVSPAISLPVSPSTDENYITESDGNKRSNQSGSIEQPNCYKCKYRRPVPGDAHSQCVHPVLDVIPGGQFVPMLFMLKGLRSPIEKKLNLSYSQHGFKNGWFMWPVNFDPTWLETCEGFEDK